MKKKSNFLIASLFIFEMLFNAFISFGQPVTPLSDDGLKFNSGQIDFENKNDGYKRDEDKNYPDLDKMFKSYEILDINSAAFVNSILTGPTEVIITLPVNNGKMLDLKIQSSGIIGTEHSTLVSDEKGIQEIQGINALPMKGIVKEMPDSEVSLTFNQNFIYGFIKTDKEFVFIEPLYHFVNKAPYDQYVIYNTEDIIVDTELRCGLTEMESERTKLKKENIDIRVSLLGNYYLVRYNTASDFSMFNHYGGITQVQNHNTGVLNNMQSNYDNEFNDEIRFQMGQQFVSTCNTCDPWTNSTNADVLLTSFRNWAPNGFNQAYDCASLWTRRDLDGSTIGIAYNPGICNGTLRVNVLQDWSTNAQLKRVMLAHEVGHNFDADHDAENSSFIMTPTNNNTNTWSTTSINTVGNYCDNISCLSVARRPANVTASDGTFFDKVTIGWTGQAGNFFRVYRNTTNNSSTATALGSWQTNTFYYDLSAVPLQTYYYWVKASLNSSGTQCSILSISNTGWKNGVTIPTNVLASDGTYFDKVQITWTGTSGHYFRVYRNTSNNSSTATALGSWQTSTTYNDASANPLATFYYWVKAASDGNGSNSSAFSSSNSGWRNAVQSPTNVQASDGTYFDKVIVTWSGYGPYFRVYRNTTNNSSTATALGSWQTSPTYNDVSANP
ncbi:MAG: M12 family metallo-peptidase, partial [Deltaproteobacteria bacterium]